MNAVIKFITGMAVTVGLALGAHSGLDLGARFIDSLESRATSTLGEAGGVGVSLAFVREPALARVAILSGDTDAFTRDRLRAAILAVPGVSGVRWTSPRGGSAAARAEAR